MQTLSVPPAIEHPNSLWLSLVLPTYNEGKNIAAMLQQLTQLLDNGYQGRYELIVVDDNSPDGTGNIAEALTSKYPHLKVLQRTQERGLSTAVIRGWQTASGQVLGVIDADLQHPPEILLQLLAEMEQGADIAIASRHIDGGGVSEWNIVRRFLSRGAQMLGLVILPEVISRLSDPMSGYFLIKRSTIAGSPLNPVGYKILIEVMARGRIRWLAEVGYVFQERQSGESKVTWRHYIEYLQHLFTLRLSRSCRFIRFCTVGLSGVLVDMAVLFVLSDPTMLGWRLTRSKILAAELAIINNFFWNDRWTFRDLAQRQPSRKQQLKRFIKFNGICLSGLILNVLLLNVFFNILQLDRYLANLLAIAAVTAWNFWFNLKLSWRVTEVK